MSSGSLGGEEVCGRFRPIQTGTAGQALKISLDDWRACQRVSLLVLHGLERGLNRGRKRQVGGTGVWGDVRAAAGLRLLLLEKQTCICPCPRPTSKVPAGALFGMCQSVRILRMPSTLSVKAT